MAEAVRVAPAGEQGKRGAADEEGVERRSPAAVRR
jgi:hypothetical protein